MDTQTLLQEIARLSPDQFKVVREFVMSQNNPAQGTPTKRGMSLDLFVCEVCHPGDNGWLARGSIMPSL